ADLADGTKERLVPQWPPERFVERARPCRALAVGRRKLRDDVGERRLGVEPELPRESAVKLAAEPAARDLAVSRPPDQSGEPADVLEARTRRTGVQRDRWTEPAAARDEVQAERPTDEHERSAGPGSGEQDEQVGGRVDAVVVLVERDRAASRHRRR